MGERRGARHARVENTALASRDSHGARRGAPLHAVWGVAEFVRGEGDVEHRERGRRGGGKGERGVKAARRGRECAICGRPTRSNAIRIRIRNVKSLL
jgi:hypothetical protein